MTSLLARIERFTMASKTTGRSYEISVAPPQAPVGLPASADCPVVFVLDAILTFGTAVEIIGYGSALAGKVPAVVVGVGYGGDLAGMVRARTPDLTPSDDSDIPPVMRSAVGDETGGADTFLDFLVNELAPEVAARFRSASKTRRILFGHSLGGLFAVHALMTRPEAFETFAASAPSLWWNDFAVLKLRGDLDARLTASGVRPKVFLSVGALEQQPFAVAPPGWDLDELNRQLARCRMVDATRELAASLTSAPLGPVHHVVFEGEGHISTLPAALSRALNFALTPQA